MVSWVYVYSKFTSEALLFEAFGICLLLSTYAAFWVLRKRKHGVIENEVPAGVVKGYLSQLIIDAQTMQAQLFGLLRAAGVQVPADAMSAVEVQQMAAAAQYAAPPANAGASAADPMLLQKMKELEAKMVEQKRAMDGVLGEKIKIEKELAEARAAGGKSSGGGAGDGAAMADLQKKVQVLEGKLAEYSVIEDDLANLKRLQQENAQLRAALAGQGGGAIAAGAPIAAAAVAAEASQADDSSGAMEDPLANVGGGGDGFEGLVDQVEQSLKSDAPAAEAEPTLTAAAPAANSAEEGKSDDDLLAEFEKMLNG